MSRRHKDPLRPLLDEERVSLSRLSRSGGAPAARVARARAPLAVAEGRSYTAAARLAGRRPGDTVARWVAGFDRDGLAAGVPRHGGGQPIRSGEVERRRILAEVARPPDRARDGTASRSLNTPRAASRRAQDGLPGVSPHTIGRTLHASGLGRRKSRTRCETGVVVRERKRDGVVGVTDPDAAAKRGRSSAPTRSAPASAGRCGARTKPVHSRRCRIPGAIGDHGADPPRGRTSPSGAARANS